MKNILAEYLCIFPNKKFSIIKCFYQMEVKLGKKNRASLIQEISYKSNMFGKKTRLEEMMRCEFDDDLEQEIQEIFEGYYD